MKITIAKNAGFCFGVRRAIDLTFKVRQQNPGARIFTVGPIIHNPQVIEALTNRGIGIVDDVDDERLASGNIAIIRAHGISPDKKQVLERRGVKVIDATCPMVLKVHSIIKKAAKTADMIAIVGDKDHPEMDAHLGVAGSKGIMIENIEDARKIEHIGRLAVVAQTTFEVHLFKDIIAELREKADVLEVSDTICRSTVDRQKEVRDLAKNHDTLVVIGGQASANTARLAEIASSEKRNVLRVETADQLKGVDTSRINRVAIIAGASTPQWVIEECIETLKSASSQSSIRQKTVNFLVRSPLLQALGGLGIAMAALVFCSQPYQWDILLVTFMLAFACAIPVKGSSGWINWSVATGTALCTALIFTSLKGGLLIIAISLLRPFLDSTDMKDYVRKLGSMVLFALISIIVPLSLAGADLNTGLVLLAAYLATHYLGTDILAGLKSMERDAIIGKLSMVRHLGENKAIMLLEYTIMGLALLIFISFPLKITPALAYGLLPALFFIAKGIDLYNDQRIFDNQAYLLYVKGLWLILPLMGVLWQVTMM